MRHGRSSRDPVSGQDLPRHDPKFKAPRLLQYLDAVAALERFARERYGCGVLALTVRWLLDQHRQRHPCLTPGPHTAPTDLLLVRVYGKRL